MSCSMRDIAEKLGVSTMTVSRALNGQDGVSRELRRQIRKTAEEMGYRKNTLSSSLKRGRTYSIGVCIPDMGSDYYEELLRSIHEAASSMGYTVLAGCSYSSPKYERDVVNSFVGNRVEGLLVGPVTSRQNNRFFTELIEQGIPLIFIDRHLPGLPVDYVTLDNVSAGFIATQHLIDAGHREIGFIAGPDFECAEVQDRYVGYQRALRSAGIDGETVLSCTIKVHHHEEYGYTAVKEFIRQKGSRLTALFAVNDNVAIGAMAALKELGVEVPENVSVVGCDNIPSSAYLSPPLTTIHQDGVAIGKTGFQMLMEMAKTGQPINRKVLTSPSLVVRKSVAFAEPSAPLGRSGL